LSAGKVYEPATLLLLGLGAVMLRRKRQIFLSQLQDFSDRLSFGIRDFKYGFAKSR
jgi:hypothetical protein